MYCEKCGVSNPDTARFCRGCGRLLTKNASEEELPSVVDRSCSPTQPKNAGQQVNKVANRRSNIMKRKSVCANQPSHLPNNETSEPTSI